MPRLTSRRRVQKSERVTETAAAETDEQEQYSLEEVRLLLKLLQLSKGR